MAIEHPVQRFRKNSKKCEPSPLSVCIVRQGCDTLRDETKQIYEQRMQSVLDYIAENLDNELDLEELASVANFSTFHFHRVFRGVTGESIANLVRRLRLERAAWRLLNGVEPISIIARMAAYDSNRSFTRAFRTAFGETPSLFRSIRRNLPSIQSPSGYHFQPENGIQTFTPVRKGDKTVEARTVTLEPMKILRVKHRGAYFKIGSAFEKLSDFVGKNGIDVSKSQWLGIYWGDPESIPEEELRSEACVTFEGDIEIPEGSVAEISEIPGGLYATTRHSGSYSELGKSWGELCGIWIPRNNYKPRNSACFEIYIKGGDCGSDESEYITDLYEPVEPLS